MSTSLPTELNPLHQLDRSNLSVRSAQPSFPSMFNPTHTPASSSATSLVVEDGSIVAATLEELVEQLLTEDLHQSRSASFDAWLPQKANCRDVFLSTYPAFTTASHIFNRLEARFQMAESLGPQSRTTRRVK